MVIDENYGGLATDDEGERCAHLLSDPAKKVLIMGNHGVLVLGDGVADAFNRLYYFERAAGNVHSRSADRPPTTYAGRCDRREDGAGAGTIFPIRLTDISLR